MMKIKGLLLLVALLAWVQGAFADDDVFEYDDDNNTVISGINANVNTYNLTTLTIPAKVTEVLDEAFQAATKLEELYIAGGDPIFGANVFNEDAPLSNLYLGSGMSSANIRNLIFSIGTDNDLDIIEIDGYTDPNARIKWTDMVGYLSDNVKVRLPAELVGDQVFGDAQVYGHFSLEHDLVTFCGKQNFQDIDNPNMLFYVPTHLENGSVYIKRVFNILANEGFLIHPANGMSADAYLPRKIDLEIDPKDDEFPFHQSNMLVGVTEPTTIDETDGNKTNFVLYEGKFYPTSGGTLGANRAYLQVPTSDVENLSNLTIIYEEEEDGIIQLRREETAAQRAGWYTLGGQRISQPQQAGIYVHNGRLETVK